MNIAPSKNRDAIRLQFTVEGVRFSFSPIPGGKWENKHDRQLAVAIANKIENDVRAGNFDSTLQKYRHNASCTQNTGNKTSQQRARKIFWLEIWDGFVESLRLAPATAADHYACVRAQILKANPLITETAWFTDRTDLASSTFNRRLRMLAKAADWAVDQKKITKNPLGGVEGRSATLAEEEREESKKAPFNSLEVCRIISYFYERHPSYAPFVEFLLFSGVRTGEGVGLRWCDVDMEKQTIAIEQSLSRERGGYRKVAKRPKTLQSRRLLRMSVRVYELFLKIKNGGIFGDKELVFKSPTGCEIDHGNFRSSYWKPALAALEIMYRKPSATRHTLLSVALESGLSVPQVAAIAGHKNSRMVVQHYGRQINQPQLPE